MGFTCGRCSGNAESRDPRAHTLPCAVCGKAKHSACQHLTSVAWVCPVEECEKVIPGSSSPAREKGIRSHRKSHGLSSELDTRKEGAGSGFEGLSFGWLGGLADGIGGFVGGLFD